MPKKPQVEYSSIVNDTMHEKALEYKRQAKRANTRIGRLEQSNSKGYIYQQALNYNSFEMGRTTAKFYEGTKFDTEEDLNYALQNVLHFNNSETSTVAGYKKDVKNKQETFKNKKIKIADENISDFLSFLYTSQFKELRKTLDSNQIITDFNRAIDDGFTVDEIKADYEKFLTTEMTFEQVSERRAEILGEINKATNYNNRLRRNKKKRGLLY